MYRLGELIYDICLLASVVLVGSVIIGFALGVYSGLEPFIMIFATCTFLLGAEGVAITL